MKKSIDLNVTHFRANFICSAHQSNDFFNHYKEYIVTHFNQENLLAILANLENLHKESAPFSAQALS